MTRTHVLVVDDDPSIAELTMRALDGYCVSFARNGGEALAAASALVNCDLLITDYVMPSMSGDELAGRLRERWPALKTVLMSGYADTLDPDRSVVDACVAKPLGLLTLRQTVIDLLGPGTARDDARSDSLRRM